MAIRLNNQAKVAELVQSLPSTSVPTITQVNPSVGVVGTTSLSSIDSIAIDQANNVFLVNVNGATPVVAKYAPTTSAGLGAQITTTGAVPSFSASGGISPAYNLIQPSILVGPTNNVEINATSSGIYNAAYSGGTYAAGTKLGGGPASNTGGFGINGLGTTVWVDEPSYICSANSSAATSCFNPNGTSSYFGTLDAESRLWVTGQNTASGLAVSRLKCNVFEVVVPVFHEVEVG